MYPSRVIYTLNDVHSPLCLSRRRARRHASESTLLTEHSTEIELSDTSDDGEYDEFGRPHRPYVRSPSLPMLPPVKPKPPVSIDIRKSATPQLPPPLTVTSDLQDPASGPCLTSGDNPDLLSEYIEDLIASLDEPMPQLDISAQRMTTEQLLAAVREPLMGFQDSELGTQDFLASLDQNQLEDLAPRLTRAVSIIQSIAPSDMHKSTSSANHETAKSGPNYYQQHSQNLEEPYSGNQARLCSHDDQEQHSDQENHMRARYPSIAGSLLDAELARAMQSPEPSPPAFPYPRRKNGYSNGAVDPNFDIYQIFPSYDKAESCILSHAKSEGLRLDIIWRPTSPNYGQKGASYKCSQFCGYEVRLCDDARGEWRVTSIEGSHTRSCFPSYKGKHKGKKSHKKAHPVSKSVSIVDSLFDQLGSIFLDSHEFSSVNVSAITGITSLEHFPQFRLSQVDRGVVLPLVLRLPPFKSLPTQVPISEPLDPQDGASFPNLPLHPQITIKENGKRILRMGMPMERPPTKPSGLTAVRKVNRKMKIR